MSYLKYELKTIIHNKKLMVCFWGLLLLNAALLFFYIGSDKIDSSVYRDTKNSMLKGETDIYDYYMENPESPECRVLFDEYFSAEHYPDYVNKVVDEAQVNRTISVFQTKFSLSNLEKTERDYRKLLDADVHFVGGYGLARVMQYAGSHIIILLFLIILVLEVVFRDKKNGLLELYKTTANGCKRLVPVKFVSSLICLFFFVVSVYGTDAAVSVMKYGQVDMSAPIQSILQYSGFGYCWSIGGYLVINILCKLAAFTFVLAALFLIMLISVNEAVAVIWISALMCVSAVLKAMGRKAGSVALLRLNLLGILDTELFFSYLNYNIFNNAVDAIRTDVLVFLAVTVCVVVAAGMYYAKAGCGYSEGFFCDRFRRLPVIRSMKFGMNRSLWALEGYKLWFGYRLFLAVFLLVAIQIYTYENRTVHWGMYESSYLYYMKQIEGDVTEDKIAFLEAEEMRYGELRAEYDSLDERLLNGEISDSEYNSRTAEISKELMGEEGFYRCRRYADYVLEAMGESGSQNGTELGFVYDRGWNMLIGKTEAANDLLNAVKLSLILFIAIAFLWLEDYKYRINSIIETTGGYRRLMTVKLLRTLLTAVITYILVYAPDIVWISNNIGLSGGNYGIKSLEYLKDVRPDISITGYIIMINAIRLVTILLLLYIIVMIGRKIKNTRVMIIASILVVIFPLILAYLGASGFDKYVVVRLLSGNKVFVH